MLSSILDFPLFSTLQLLKKKIDKFFFIEKWGIKMFNESVYILSMILFSPNNKIKIFLTLYNPYNPQRNTHIS